MYLVTRTYEGITDPGKAGEVVDQEFLDLVSAIPGFEAYYWADAGEGTMVSISVFADADGAEESVRAARRFIQERGLGSLFPNAPNVLAGEVVAHA